MFANINWKLFRDKQNFESCITERERERVGKMCCFTAGHPQKECVCAFNAVVSSPMYILINFKELQRTVKSQFELK
jgi:hypothetical protein